MNATLRGGFVAVGLLVGLIAGAPVASAQSFSFPVGGFTATNVCANGTTPLAACQVLTDGSPNQPAVISSGYLRLTTANENQHGSAWFYVQQPLSTGFTTAFQFQLSNAGACNSCAFPGDGMAFVIQNDPAGTGALGYTGNGQNITYGNDDNSTGSGPGNAIINSLAIELDTYQNSDYGDPDGNHIAVQSCGPNNANTLTPNSADHTYICPDGSPAKLALQSLPSGLSLSDGNTHTITVNYLPPGNCTSNCNNLSVYMDSTLILQATLDITKQLNLSGNGGAYVGFTAGTGAAVENSDIVSWSFSSLPLAPITITQPLQTTTTNFNYTPSLSAISDYSQSGLGSTAFQGVFMQGTVQTITDQQYADLVNNTPFQGTTCQHQDTGMGNYGCVITTDLCTNSTSSVPSGANCPNTGTNALINVSNTYNLDPSQKPIVAPGYLMGKDTALGCGATADNTCKGLVNIFTSISGDPSSNGRTNNFNSILIPVLGVVEPGTSVTTNPQLNSGWTNGNVQVTLSGSENPPGNNMNLPASLPTVTSITYGVTGANLPSPASGTISGATGSFLIPGTVEGTTVVTYSATDSAGTPETVITNSGGSVSSASPTFTIKFDLTPPALACVGPNPAPSGWQASDVVYNCTASDAGSGLASSSQPNFMVSTNVPANTETSGATIPLVTVFDVAGNSNSQGPFGPFEVDKKAPVIMAPTISPALPTYGQIITATYSCTDEGSGVVQCGPTGSATFPATGNTGTLSTTVDNSVGSHTFTVAAQDAVGNVSTPSSVNYTVGQATPTVTFTGAPPSAPYLSTFPVAATTNASTTAKLTAGGACSIAGNVVTMTSGTGVCLLTATWAADNNYVGATASQSTAAIKDASAAAITSNSPNPSGVGQAVTVGFKVTGVSIPTGSVTVTASTGEFCGAALSGGAGSCSLTFLTGGTRTLTAAYSGDTNFSGTTSSPVTQSVTQALVSFSPTSLNFGNVALGKLAALIDVVSNTGNATLKINGISLKLGTGSDKDDFAFVTTCGTSLAPGAKCLIVLGFNADDLGVHNAALQVTDNAGGSPQQIPITANVVKK